MIAVALLVLIALKKGTGLAAVKHCYSHLVGCILNSLNYKKRNDC